MALVNSTIETLRKKTRLRDRTGGAWFISQLLRHLARKQSRSILSTGSHHRVYTCEVRAFAMRACTALKGLVVNTECAANSGRDGHCSTISYQLSSQKCLDDGWTVWPAARQSLHSFIGKTTDTDSSCDELLEPDEPMYKVN